MHNENTKVHEMKPAKQLSKEQKKAKLQKPRTLTQNLPKRHKQTHIGGTGQPGQGRLGTGSGPAAECADRGERRGRRAEA